MRRASRCRDIFCGGAPAFDALRCGARSSDPDPDAGRARDAGEFTRAPRRLPTGRSQTWWHSPGSVPGPSTTGDCVAPFGPSALWLDRSSPYRSVEGKAADRERRGIRPERNTESGKYWTRRSRSVVTTEPIAGRRGTWPFVPVWGRPRPPGTAFLNPIPGRKRHVRSEGVLRTCCDAAPHCGARSTVRAIGLMKSAFSGQPKALSDQEFGAEAMLVAAGHDACDGRGSSLVN